MMIIQVVVDIPAKQVNRSFDYLVPQELQETIELGMRVQLPFGNRQLLGFVVGMEQGSDYEGKLREIKDVLDYQSFLNEELIELSEYLADYLHAFRITILQAMLPSMLRVKYENIFRVKDAHKFAQATHLAVHQVSETYDKQTLESLLSPLLLRQLVQAEVIEVEYQVKDQTTKRLVPYLITTQTAQEYREVFDALDNRSHQQKKLLKYLLRRSLPLDLPLAQVLQEATVSRSVIQTAINNGLLEREDREEYRNPLGDKERIITQSRILTADQDKAFQAVHQALQNREPKTFLIEGVTGSGKTEVYLQLIEEAHRQKRGAIFLVPEISLTPQMVEQVHGRFGQGVAVLHSGLTPTERFDEWRRISSGEATIVVGARSSVFAPIKDLGLIIIDEEHETTYKQGDNPRYHARDVALWRSHYHGAPLVLGSATPSLESRARAQVGRYELLKMPERINQQPLPPVELVDMTQVSLADTADEFSPQLKTKIQERLDKKQQIVLLLNRRGYSSYVLCRECGDVNLCPHCDIALTYHKVGNVLRCHYCNFKAHMPSRCKACGSSHLCKFGLGTQQVAETLKKLYPQARTLRMDVDTTRRKGDHERILTAFGNHEADILLGTQMIAKGLDFSKVTLVGVINGDTSLNLPDFRSSEKTFQLLTQVAGRTGRGDLPGEVVIQTYNPDHYVMQLVKRHDYDQFFYYEMNNRHLGNYPPYYYLTLIGISSNNPAMAQEQAYQLKAQLVQAQKSQDVLIIGPSEAAVAKVNDYYHYQLLLKYKNQDQLHDQLYQLLEESQAFVKQGLFINIDHDPLFF